MYKCPDCETEIILADIEENEIVSCPNCGLELTYKNGKLVSVPIEGEDWGE
jgi:alpha-aminoadipate/glutamate carrier protein LysW